MSSLRNDLNNNVKEPVCKLSAKEYASLHGFHHQHQLNVRIVIGEMHSFTIPKDFLTKYSEYFRATFEGSPIFILPTYFENSRLLNIDPYFQSLLRRSMTNLVLGDFEETEELALSLENIEVETFQYILQWIGTGDIVLEDPSDDNISKRWMATKRYYENHSASYTVNIKDFKEECLVRDKLSQYIDILLAADFLLLTSNPTTLILRRILEIFEQRKLVNSVQSSLLFQVWKLPTSHPARKFFVQACVAPYVTSRFDRTCTTAFEYEAAMNMLPGFSIMLLDMVFEAMANPVCYVEDVTGVSVRAIKNPLEVEYLKFITIYRHDISQL